MESERETGEKEAKDVDCLREIHRHSQFDCNPKKSEILKDEVIAK